MISYAGVEEAKGNLPKAIEIYEEAMNILSRHNLTGDLADCLCELSNALIKLHSHDRAERLLADCLELYKKAENPDGESRALIIYGTMEFARKNLKKAREYALRACEISDPIRTPGISASARILLARSSSQEKERVKAIELLQEALKIAENDDLIALKVESLLYLAETYHSFDPVKGP